MNWSQTQLLANFGIEPATFPAQHRFRMFSHVVIFWTRPEAPSSADALIAGAEKYLRDIPGVTSFHAGKMVPSHRPVVESSYQVALNVQFASKSDQDAYQVHPRHLAFVDAMSPLWHRVAVYDFE